MADINTNLIHSVDDESSSVTFKFLGMLVAVALVAGVVGGFVVNSFSGGSDMKGAGGSEKSDKVVGVPDKKTFKDKAEGLLKEGGKEGEGSYHLERPGGESQNVYLTSTTVDLSQYVSKKVRVWGATYSSEKAGWLMDVGLVEVLQ